MMSVEVQPERVLILRVPACEPEHTPTEHRSRAALLWQSVLTSVQRTVPGAVELSPGCCAMRARGPTRYYGSEESAAQAVLKSIDELLTGGLEDGVTVGIANGRFAATQAAWGQLHDPHLLTPSPGVRLVETEHTVEFLSGLPIACAAPADLAAVLVGLGIHTLGAFASLPEQAVRERFGQAAYAAHRRARGLGELHGSEVRAGMPQRDLAISFEFEPPLAGIDQLAFACSTHAEQFIHVLSTLGLVCTELRVTLIDDTATPHEHSWSHPANFTATDIVNRVRWQATKLPLTLDRGGAGTAAGIAAVRIEPERTALAAAHEPGLWSNAPNEKVHHQLTRVQSLLGPEGVGTGLVIGGRMSSSRQQFTHWGAEPVPSAPSGPWPGHLTGPLPNLLCPRASPISLLDERSTGVVVDADELLSGVPAMFLSAGAPPRRVRSWSAPWPLREQWWEEDAGDSPLYRLQIELEDGAAWLLRYAPADGWAAEGYYA